MPCILKIRISCARNLPVMDRSTELTDAYVEIKFHDYESLRTQIARKTLNPVWNEDFRFEVSDDSDLQNEPLELKVMDYDQLTYNDGTIGCVFIDINPLLTWDTSAQISGWFPIHDSLLGVRGELHAHVKLQFFGDVNPFNDSSANVQFYSSTIPPGYRIQNVLGFVSALEYADDSKTSVFVIDPEYHWADNFRSPRKSNESRILTMFRLSGNCRRELGKKALELKGNAVIGCKQYFDLETTQKTIVTRSIGTAVLITKSSVSSDNDSNNGDHSGGIDSLDPFPLLTSSFSSQNFTAPNSRSMSSPNPQKSIPQSPAELATSESTTPPDPVIPITLPSSAVLRSATKPADPIFLTLTQFPPYSISGIGGYVCATSIKVLDDDHDTTRDQWWAELRDEIKAHARKLCCNGVLGYTEQISISDEVVLLFCSGTAAQLDFDRTSSSTHVREDSTGDDGVDPENNLNNSNSGNGQLRESGQQSLRESKSRVSPIEIQSGSKGASYTDISPGRNGEPGRQYSDPIMGKASDYKSRKSTKLTSGCRCCHITYDRGSSPFPMLFNRCNRCKKKNVPEVLLATIEPPSELETIGTGMLIEAHVCRPKRVKLGNSKPTDVSESVPFIHYDIHRQLMYKLRIYGLNAVFGLKIQISLGESLVTAVATGTAVFAQALCIPMPLKVMRNLDILDDEDLGLVEVQRKLMAISASNRKRIEESLAQIKEAQAMLLEAKQTSVLFQHEDSSAGFATTESPANMSDSGGDSGSDDSSEIEDGVRRVVSNRSKSAIVQIDDEQDEDLVLFLDEEHREGFIVCNSEYLPGAKSESHELKNAQMVSLVSQKIIKSGHHPNRQLAGILKEVYQSLSSHFQFLNPCVVLKLSYVVNVFKEDLVQVCMTCMVCGQASKELDDVFAPELSASLGLMASSLEPGQATEGRISNAGESVQDSLNGMSVTESEGAFSDDNDDLVHELEEDTEEEEQPPTTDNAASLLIKAITGAWNERQSPSTNRKSNASTSIASRKEGIIRPGASPLGRMSSLAQGDSFKNLNENMGSSLLTHQNRGQSFRQSFFNEDFQGGGSGSGNLVDLSPSSYIPLKKVTSFLGRISLHFIKETHLVWASHSVMNGMGGFTQRFLPEILAIVRSHAVALGGNAIVSFCMDQFEVDENMSQGYALVSVSGDVVRTSNE